MFLYSPNKPYTWLQLWVSSLTLYCSTAPSTFTLYLKIHLLPMTFRFDGELISSHTLLAYNNAISVSMAFSHWHLSWLPLASATDVESSWSHEIIVTTCPHLSGACLFWVDLRKLNLHYLIWYFHSLHYTQPTQHHYISAMNSLHLHKYDTPFE